MPEHTSGGPNRVGIDVMHGGRWRCAVFLKADTFMAHVIRLRDGKNTEQIYRTRPRFRCIRFRPVPAQRVLKFRGQGRIVPDASRWQFFPSSTRVRGNETFARRNVAGDVGLERSVKRERRNSV